MGNTGIRKDPEDIEALIELADVLINQKRKSGLKEAADLANKAISLAPDNPIPYRQLAQTELSLGHYSKAEDFAHKALDLNANTRLANFVLGQCRLGRIPRAKGKAEKERLYREAMDFYEAEMEINEGFHVRHLEIARFLLRGRLRQLANHEAAVALKTGPSRIKPIFILILSIQFLWLHLLLWAVTDFLLSGFVSRGWAFLLSLPITVILGALSLTIKIKRVRIAYFITLITLGVLFIAFASAYWPSYREHNRVKPVATKTQKNYKFLDFASVHEGYNTPTETSFTWAKYVHAANIPGIWTTYSQHFRQANWNDDFSTFQNKYQDFISKNPGNAPITDFKVRDEHRVVGNGDNVYQYIIHYLNRPSGQILSMTNELFLVKEGNQWKIDFTTLFSF